MFVRLVYESFRRQKRRKILAGAAITLGVTVATAMIAVFTHRLQSAGCHTIFLGALATERPKRLYARLGFHAVTLARAWVRELPDTG